MFADKKMPFVATRDIIDKLVVAGNRHKIIAKCSLANIQSLIQHFTSSNETHTIATLDGHDLCICAKGFQQLYPLAFVSRIPEIHKRVMQDDEMFLYVMNWITDELMEPEESVDQFIARMMDENKNPVMEVETELDIVMWKEEARQRREIDRREALEDRFVTEQTVQITKDHGFDVQFTELLVAQAVFRAHTIRETSKRISSVEQFVARVMTEEPISHLIGPRMKKESEWLDLQRLLCSLYGYSSGR